MTPEDQGAVTGWIWDIKRYALHDGPGVRTTVFLKGCPLHCLWCCNPESQSTQPELAWLSDKCLGCDQCRLVCVPQAISVDQSERRIDRERCDLCGRCAAVCPTEALSWLGRQVTVDQVLRQITQDSGFFQRSGGGLTLSGGEPAAQPDFAYELLRRFKTEEYGPHAALETAGHVNWETLARLLEFTDLVLYDIKLMDPELHQRYTGVGNKLILANAARVAESGVELVIRVPLIPGHTDDEENLRAVVAFARQLPGLQEIHLLPYHRLGETKYARLGRTYALKGATGLPQGRVTALAGLVKESGLKVLIGG